MNRLYDFSRILVNGNRRYPFDDELVSELAVITPFALAGPEATHRAARRGP